MNTRLFLFCLSFDLWWNGWEDFYPLNKGGGEELDSFLEFDFPTRKTLDGSLLNQPFFSHLFGFLNFMQSICGLFLLVLG